MEAESSKMEDEPNYVDVHAQFIHEQFAGVEDEIAIECKRSGIEWVVVNGLEPTSNRKILELCSHHPGNLLAALGIYPIDAACNVIDESMWTHDFPPPQKFNVDHEIDFIDECARNGQIAAIGECGLDHFYLTHPTALEEQERVFRRLCRLSVAHHLPIIIHSRKAEKRVFEIVCQEGVQLADFHCFTGKTSLAKTIADSNPNYYFSIPSALGRMQNFSKMVTTLPITQILTETDSPYLPPKAGQRNDPRSIVSGIDSISILLANIMTRDELKRQIRTNFRRLFNR